MRQIKFKVRFKIKQYNESFKEEEIIFLESKTHEIYSLCIHGNHVVVPYNNTVLTIFQDECECIDILQFTGLVDRNGKEIYEGDIIKEKESDYSNEYRLYRVYWCDDNMQYWMSDDDIGDSFPLIELEIDYSIVIGNIHDNPELLNP